jgi:flagellar biosynthetic protein FlhB
MSDGSDDDGEKPYEPSAKKLEDARRKGEVPRSVDLMTAAAYGGVLLAAVAFGGASLQSLGTVMMVLLDRADGLAPLLVADGGATLAGGLLVRVVWPILPWFVVPAGLVLACVIAQQGFTVTGSKLAPKLNRIGLISNAKQKFGRNGLFEFAKSFVKLLVFSGVLALFLVGRIEDMAASALLDPGQAMVLLGRLCLHFMAVVLVVSLAIGMVDMLWQRAEHHRKNRMSHKDLTDEAKQTEGDPHMKQQRRQRGYDIATNRMMADVPTADVVVVNPTHYAVALRWERSPGSAPVCVAKGVDEVAARIREAAAAAGVPIHGDAPTARALHATVEIGAQIRPDHYEAVAAAIRFADRMRNQAAGRGA